MPFTRTVLLAPVLALLVLPAPCAAQIGGFLRQIREGVNDAVRCGVQGACGEIVAASHFAADSYESVAVTVIDGTSRFPTPGAQGLVRDEVESVLVEHGYLLAASANPEAIRDMIARGDDSWSEAELAQLRDFVGSIDAIVVADIRQLDLGTCQYRDIANPNTTKPGYQATVHLSYRWLNVDAGDVPWVGTHSHTVCSLNGGEPLYTEALTTAATQLSRSLPNREMP